MLYIHLYDQYLWQLLPVADKFLAVLSEPYQVEIIARKEGIGNFQENLEDFLVAVVRKELIIVSEVKSEK